MNLSDLECDYINATTCCKRLNNVRRIPVASLCCLLVSPIHYFYNWAGEAFLPSSTMCGALQVFPYFISFIWDANNFECRMFYIAYIIYYLCTYIIEGKRKKTWPSWDWLFEPCSDQGCRHPFFCHPSNHPFVLFFLFTFSPFLVCGHLTIMESSIHQLHTRMKLTWWLRLLPTAIVIGTLYHNHYLSVFSVDHPRAGCPWADNSVAAPVFSMDLFPSKRSSSLLACLQVNTTLLDIPPPPPPPSKATIFE